MPETCGIWIRASHGAATKGLCSTESWRWQESLGGNSENYFNVKIKYGTVIPTKAKQGRVEF